MFRYPITPEARAINSMLVGPPQTDVPSHVSAQFERVNRMYGSGDLDSVSRTAAVAGVAPWPRAARKRNAPLYDRDLVREALSQPRTEESVYPADPRNLHSTQPGITRDGVEYYMSDEYSNTGRTYADQGNAGNRQPVVYRKASGENLLLSGHHRAGAALLKGEPFNALHIDERGR